jgi:polyhydroxyalkanoate synthase
MTPDAWDAVLNVHAEDDHIIPPLTSPALDGKVDTKDHTELGPAVGYSGVFA